MQFFDTAGNGNGHQLGFEQSYSLQQSEKMLATRNSQDISGNDQSPVPSLTSADSFVKFGEMRKKLTCGVCSSLLASSLVLSCGHTFCGSCIFEILNEKPVCPACQVGLRSIPVHCLALDSLVEAVEHFLPEAEHKAFRARAEAGATAANKLNKMFWWLQPAAIPALGSDGGNNASSSSFPMFMQAPPLSTRMRTASCGGGQRQQQDNQQQRQLQHQQNHMANSFTVSGSSRSFTHGSLCQPQQRIPLPRAPVPGGHGYGSNMGQQNMSQALAMGSLPAMMQQQASVGLCMPLPQFNPMMDFSGQNCPPPGQNSHLANLQAQAQLQQLFKDLYLS